MSMAQVIRAAMKKQGVTVSQLSRQLGCTTQNIFVIFNPHEITSVYQNSRSSKELLRLFPEWQ